MNLQITIEVEKHAGFCFGVKRAVDLCYEAANKNHSGKIYTYGDIIHNSRVVRDLARHGVSVIEFDDIKKLSSDDTVIIRSHGIPPEIHSEIAATGARIVDGTCPFVKNIHNIVSKHSKNGDNIVIFGDKSHSEVIGIVGYALKTPLVCADFLAFCDKTRSNRNFFQKKLAIVTQTTYNIIEWEHIISNLNSVLSVIYPKTDLDNVNVYNTICDATTKRQNGAFALAERSDMAIVVGDRRSSNTKKLYDVCVSTGKTTLLSDFEDRQAFAEMFSCALRQLIRENNTPGKTLTVGVTAGASTPCEVIEEVIVTMEETKARVVEAGVAEVTEAAGAAEVTAAANAAEVTEAASNIDPESFEALLDSSLNRRVHKGSRVTGIITGIHINEVTVDIGTKQTGFVPLEDFSDIPDEDPKQNAVVGSEVELIVTQVNDAEGWVTLSKKKADAKVGYDRLVKAKESGEILEGVVTGIVNGGVVASVAGVRVFIPASHSGVKTPRTADKSIDNKQSDLSELYKKTVNLKIIEVDEKRSKAVGSIREASFAARTEAKDKFWETAEIGKVYEGTVRSLTSYGAFIDLGGVDGMIHLSELSWDRVTHPSQVVKVGETIKVYIKDLDREKNRISLGYKDPNDDPYTKFANEFSVGMDVPVRIVSIAPFGAFAQIIPGVDGLIHISQISNTRVNNAADVLKKDEEVTARITEIDLDKKRISLSIKAILDDAPETETEEYYTEE